MAPAGLMLYGLVNVEPGGSKVVNSEAFPLGPDQDYSIVIREMESRAQEKDVKRAVSYQM
jgi:hypothetical protein